MAIAAKRRLAKLRKLPAQMTVTSGTRTDRKSTVTFKAVKPKRKTKQGGAIHGRVAARAAQSAIG